MAKRLRDKRQLMIFRAFFDESGLNPHQDEAMIFGGFVGHVEEWKRASDAWDRCLHESPSIEYFSHKEANSLNEQFWKFSRIAADQKIESLATVIAESRLQGFCVSVPFSWFVNRDPKAAKGMMGSRAYDWGFLTATSGVLQYMKKLQLDYTVDFVFDKRNDLRACINTYYEMRDCGLVENMAHAGECVQGNDRDLAALQMADLLAWEFSNLKKTNLPSESWALIAGARPIAHLPCTPPPLVPETLEIQKLAAEVKGSADRLLKRIYGDKEKLWDLISDVAELQKEKAYFDLRFQRLTGIYEAQPDWQEFMEALRKVRGLADDE